MMHVIYHDVIANKEYHSTIAARYHIKLALVSWIVRKFTSNPAILSDYELKESVKKDNNISVETAI